MAVTFHFGVTYSFKKKYYTVTALDICNMVIPWSTISILWHIQMVIKWYVHSLFVMLTLY